MLLKLQVVRLLLLILPQTAAIFRAQKVPDVAYVQEGQLTIGGLVSIRAYSGDAPCGAGYSTWHKIQLPEALAFAVNEINRKGEILPNITLGFAILEDCSRGVTSLAQSTRFVPVGDCVDLQGCNLSTSETEVSYSENLLGIVGVGTSTIALSVSGFLSFYHIPHISYGATNEQLSNKVDYRYFMRIVPPDQFQMAAILALIEHYDWSYISVVYQEGRYGEGAMKNINRNSEKHGICIATANMVPSGAQDADYDHIVKTLLRRGKAKAVILILYQYNSFFSAVKRAGVNQGQFIWVMSESFDIDALDDLKYFAVGGFSMVIPQDESVETQRYIGQVSPASSPNNPWLRGLWTELFDCTWDTALHNKTQCSATTTLFEYEHFFYRRDLGVVVDAVETLARGAAALIQNHCSETNQLMACIREHDLLPYLLDVEFRGASTEVRFDQNGDILSTYLIKQVQHMKEDTYAPVVVGVWYSGEEKLDLEENDIIWPEYSLTDSVFEHPESVCSKECESNEYISLLPDQPCCWECRTCRNNERLNANRTACVACEELSWPDASSTVCLKITPSYLHWEDPIGIALIAVAITGLIASTVTAVLFARHRDRRAIRGSSIELMSIILVGFFAAFGSICILIVKPGDVICQTARIGFCGSCSLIFVPVFLKTVKIYRVFRASEKCKRSLKAVDKRSQMIFASALIIGQIILLLVTAMLFPVEVKKSMPVSTKDYVELYCDIPLPNLVLNLAYSLVMLILCAAFGFLTRHLPDNFNESWCIFITVTTTLVIWLGFFPTYFLAFYAYHKAALLGLALILNASAVLLVLFLPKIYAVFFVDEKSIKISAFSENVSSTETSENVTVHQMEKSR